MTASDRLHDAVRSGRGTAAADAVCRAYVDHTALDAAAVSLVFDGVSSGTLGTSGPRATVLDEVQFTLGQGPCLDSVSSRRPVLVTDLDHRDEQRWPEYRSIMLGHRICAVFAFPVVVAGEFIGALDLFRERPGPLAGDELAAALTAAELLSVPLLDIAAASSGQLLDTGGPGWNDVHTLTRIEVAQATGMVTAQLDIDPVHALARLRAHAYATGRSATEVARDILDRTLRLEPDPPSVDH